MTVMLLQNNATPSATAIFNNNNNNNNVNKTSCDGGPSTIEEQYKNLSRQVNIDLRLSQPRLNLFSLPGGVKHKGRAMNYYRLWIYTCNAVLLLSVVGFIIVAASVVIVDPRRSLIPGLSLYHPSLLYAYLCLLAQCGVLQVVGCLGAIKLNEKLLNTYWLLLLFLLFGDAIIGIVWIFKFDKIYTELGPILKQRLQHEYGVDVGFTSVWNNIQHEFQCCGVEGPQDYNTVDLSDENDKNRVDGLRTNDRQTDTPSTDFTWLTSSPPDNETDDGTTYTNNWMFTNMVTMSSVNNILTTTATGSDGDVKFVTNVPESCCRLLQERNVDEDGTQVLVVQKRRSRDRSKTNEQQPQQQQQQQQKKKRYVSFRTRHESSYRNTHTYPQSNSNTQDESSRQEDQDKQKQKIQKYSTGNVKIMKTCARMNGYSIGTVYGMTETLHFSVGCELGLKTWLTESAHLLAVLGYCVVAFLKLCFLGILRYEIKEMIQKIKLIQGEFQPPILLLSADSPEVHENNSPGSPPSRITCNHTEKKSDAGNALLLLQPPESNQTTPVHQIKTIQMTQNHRLLSNILHNDGGNDSDTNSHSPLLLEREESYRKYGRVSSNGNNNYETHEMQELLLSRSTQI